ncbi:MAG: sugar ABC transporter permease [Candidatus Cloacimonetes bacterium]|nr:sugar ABC transporter permease [Candidatus Cloacimonadota bacterium]MBS3767420.1 sugar ABC transporter permease [Candidatus Cloacimonadota bacterium]
MNEKSKFTPFLYILPAALIVIIFRLVPITLSFLLSFFKWTIRGPEKFIAFQNYVKLFNDPQFWQSLLNTVFLVIFVVPSTLIFSLFFANLLNKTKALSGFFRTTFFVPTVTSLVAISIVWKLIFAQKSGLMNHFLSLFGINGLGWLSESRGIFDLLFGAVGINFKEWLHVLAGGTGIPFNTLYIILGGPSLALFAIIIVTVWRSLGYNTIVYLAGLQSIPDIYYEAAEIDGASKFKQFFKITVPLISPTTYYVLLMTTIVTFRVFSQVYLMTGPPVGGPLGTTKVIVYYIFETGLGEAMDLSYASTIALVLFFIILSVTLLQRKLEKKVHY